MADQSHITKPLFEDLPPADEPAGWRSAPVIDCWGLEASPNEREVAVTGLVVGSEKFRNGGSIRTSALRSVDSERRFIVTQNSIYQLGWPARASLDADSDHVWPPVLSVVACANWYVASSLAQHYTGAHTLTDAVMADLTAASQDDGSWEERRAACRSIADALFRAERKLVAEAWGALGVDLRSVPDRNAAKTFVFLAAQHAYHQCERALVAYEVLADSGWRLLASMDDARIEKLPEEGVSIDDPIAAAHKIALIAIRAGGQSDRIDPDSGVPADVYVDPVSHPEAPANEPGVVVLREIGGIESNWSGREVKRAVGAILGKRLPLRPAPKTVAIRRALVAEFPHAQAAIDVILSDLVGARYARFRNSILVGPTGAGKSLLARRLAELVGLHTHFFDGAGASDNAFGGTARRWSTGEPATPVLAMIAAKAANAVILIDEIDKAATGGENGRLWDALLPYVEPSTAARAGDPYLHAPVDCSHLSYIATANDERLVPASLRDRFRILRVPTPTVEHLPALCRSIVQSIVQDLAHGRGIVQDLAHDSGMSRERNLDADELWIAERLWGGGSLRRLREIVSRIVVRRAEKQRH